MTKLLSVFKQLLQSRLFLIIKLPRAKLNLSYVATHVNFARVYIDQGKAIEIIEKQNGFRCNITERNPLHTKWKKSQPRAVARWKIGSS